MCFKSNCVDSSWLNCNLFVNGFIYFRGKTQENYFNEKTITYVLCACLG